MQKVQFFLVLFFSIFSFANADCDIQSAANLSNIVNCESYGKNGVEKFSIVIPETEGSCGAKISNLTDRHFLIMSTESDNYTGVLENRLKILDSVFETLFTMKIQNHTASFAGYIGQEFMNVQCKPN